MWTGERQERTRRQRSVALGREEGAEARDPAVPMRFYPFLGPPAAKKAAKNRAL